MALPRSGALLLPKLNMRLRYAFNDPSRFTVPALDNINQKYIVHVTSFVIVPVYTFARVACKYVSIDKAFLSVSRGG